ncbi:hypothetical protein U1Q18_031671 [Sarracenia purpurea var. burkii]
MEAFSMLNIWRIAAGEDIRGGGGSDTYIPMTSSGMIIPNVCRQAAETDEGEDSFFDLEFTVPGYDEKEHNDARDVDVNASDSDEDSYSDLAEKDRKSGANFVASPKEPNSKPQSPISFLRSPPKFRVLMLFKKPKLEKTETCADVSQATPKHHRQINRFAEKCKVEEVSIFSLLTRVYSSRSNLQKQSFPKVVIQKYRKLIKPLYAKASKRYSEKLEFSGEFSISSPLSSPVTAPSPTCVPRKQADEKQGSRQAPLGVMRSHLVKSQSVSSVIRIIPAPPPATRRDDSLLEQHDGIQSAILHCKRSYNSSRDFSVLSRSASDPSCELPVNPSTEQVKTRTSI